MPSLLHDLAGVSGHSYRKWHADPARGPTPLLFESTVWLIIHQGMDELQTTEDGSQDPGTPKPGTPHSQAGRRLQKMALDSKLPTRRHGTQKDYSFKSQPKERSYDSDT